jgi:hypothetical protein
MKRTAVQIDPDTPVSFSGMMEKMELSDDLESWSGADPSEAESV